MMLLVTLPPPDIPFFAPTSFTVKADLYKLGTKLVGNTENKLFQLDAAYPDYVRAKLELLREHPALSRCYLTTDQQGLGAALWQLAEVIADDQPDYFDYQEGRLMAKLLGLGLDKNGLLLELRPTLFSDLKELCQQHLKSLSPFDRLCDFLALAVQEDLVIMQKTGDQAGADQAECLLVALPSHWNPADKLGLDFGAIHAPVADNSSLLKAQSNLLKAMTQKGPFVRYNWSLARTEALSQNPALMPERITEGLEADSVALNPDTLLDRHYYRVERQTFYPFSALQRGLFAIRIYQASLSQVLYNPKRKAQFASTLNSMSEALLTYKNINKKALLRALGNN